MLLSQGNWPNLAELDISGNSLDAEGMSLLANGNRPLLAIISLSFSPTLDANAVAHLSAVNWPTKRLTISDTPFNPDTAAKLANLQCPNLKELYLTESALTAAAMSELARADWPSLRMLVAGHDDLDALGILLGLAKVEEPKSHDACDCAELYMQRRVLQPGVSVWPNLQWIRISKHRVELGVTKVVLTF